MGERTEQVITLSLPSSMQHVNLLNVVVTQILEDMDSGKDIQVQINLAVIEAGTTEQVITLSLPSSMQHVNLLDNVVTQILEDMDFGEDIQVQINLAVIEAGTNAIRHGNKEDLGKKATFQFILAEDRLAIVIKDEGEGFTRQTVADPLDPENLLKSSGRGLFLMEACMDSVTYEAKGTIIKMVKYKETSNP